MGTDVNRLLAISWAMPPMLFPRSIQVARTLKALSAQGWRSTVICVNPSSNRRGQNDVSLENMYMDYYETVTISSYEQTMIWGFLSRFPLIRKTKYSQGMWTNNAIQTAKKILGANKFSVIVSFAQPWSDHLIGLHLHRVSGIPWVAHFSDPWLDNPYERYMPFERSIVQQMEEAIIREASGVVFVTAQTADLVMQKYPAAWREKVRVIPHGYEEPDDLGLSHAHTPELHERMRLVYIGNFYGKRTPAGLLHALSILNKKLTLAKELEVTVSGKNTRKYQSLAEALGLRGIVKFGGPVLYEMGLHLSAEADVLILIDAPSRTESPFLPSKIVDYLAFKKPILGITPSQGASANLLQRLKFPVLDPDDIQGISCAIARLLEDWRNDRLNVTPEFRKIAQEYNVAQTSRIFNQLLCRVVAGPK